jgi:3D (Asp-Asp-Asp) domain-containing protein
MLSLGLLFPMVSLPTVKNHVVAVARTLKPAPHAIRLLRDGEQQELRTSVATVGDLLQEQGITAGPDDTLTPSADTPLSDGLLVTYRSAVSITLVVSGARETMMSSAPDVATLLAQRQIILGPQDRLVVAPTDALEAGMTVRVIHVTEWARRVREKIAPIVEHRLSLALAPSASKVVSRGAPTIRERLIRYRQIDNEPRFQKTIIESRIVSKGKPKVVLSGFLAYERYAALAKRGFEGTIRLANSAFHMLATAYTANCAGCSGSGMTATGMRAGHGIVAVDPRVIPLGTRLYIKGYGQAIAGDTGGAIRGNRIDLGFDSIADAMTFGTREVHVYILR